MKVKNVKKTLKMLMLLVSSVLVIVCAGCAGSSSQTSAPTQNISVLTTEKGSGKTDEKQDETTDISSGDVSVAEVTVPDQSDITDKTLVIYFSATGTTKGVAERIASVTNADMYEIIPAEPYSDADLNWNDSSSRTTVEMNDPDVRPGIASADISFDGYSRIFIGYPIWWGDAPRIMSTFVESHSFDGITVIPFCTSSSSGIGRSGTNLAAQAGSGNWLAGGRLQANISESEITDWINGMS